MFIIIGGDGKEYGPVTTDQIRTWIAAGRANLDTKAKAIGSDEWRRVGDYAEFSGAPVPPLVSSAAGGTTFDSTQAAGRGARIGAAFVNAFFYFLCILPGWMMMTRKVLSQYPELARGGFPRVDEIDPRIFETEKLWLFAGFFCGILIQALLLGLRGQNLGKMLVGIRVVRADTGETAGFINAALLRFLMPVMLMVVLTMFTGVLGVLFLLVDFCFIFREDGRCLHDLMAGTRVAKK
jgi:uncharacterized RDD family membrane protein YckC